MKPIRLASTALATLSVFTLTGCMLGVTVEGDSGIGTCEGEGDVSIATSQNESGDSLTIDYYGPGTVSIGVVHGFYSENNFYDTTPTKLLGFGDGFVDGESVPNVNLSLINEIAGWTITPSGDGMHAAYDGTVADFVTSLGSSVFGAVGDADEVGLIVPFTVGVLCDQTILGGTYSEVTDEESPVESFMGGVAAGFQFAAAQPVFPNHIATGPIRILTQAVTEGEIGGTLQLPAGIVEQLGDFTLDTSGEFSPIDITFTSDPTEIPNGNMSDLWYQYFFGSIGGGGYGIEVEAPYSLTNPMPFTVALEPDDPAISDGDYLVFMALTGRNSDDEMIVKMVVGSASYSEADGLVLTEIDVPLSGGVEETPELSDTGVGTGALVLAGFGAALVGVGVTALAARRRRA